MKDIKCFFENNALHDYEVGQISINYSNGTIIMSLISDKGEVGDPYLKGDIFYKKLIEILNK